VQLEDQADVAATVTGQIFLLNQVRAAERAIGYGR